MVTQISSPDVQSIFYDMVMPVKIPGKDGKMTSAEPVYKKAIKDGLPKLAKLYKTTFEENKIDGLLFPTVPEVAIKTGPEVGTPEHFLRIIRNTDPSSNVSMPGISIPVGLGPKTQLPVGMEIDGLPGKDAEILSIAKTLESIWGPSPIPEIAH